MNPEVRRLHLVLSKLVSRAESSPATADETTKELRHAFLEFGSETPDNLGAVGAIELGLATCDIGRSVEGLKLQGPPYVLLSELTNYLEGSPIPTKLAESHPDLTESDWNAMLRWLTIILMTFERRLSGQELP